MRRRTQAEMDQLVEAAGFRKIEQRIDEWGIFTVSLAERIAGMSAIGSQPQRDRRLAGAAVARAPRSGSRFLAPFFYLTYGAANWLAALRDDVAVDRLRLGARTSRSSPGRSFPTGRSTPSTACRSSSAPRKRELDTHGRRLLTAQIVAVACFILFPLRFTFAQPETRRRCRVPVRGADELRQAVQPGAVAAYRAAGDPVGALCAPSAALGAVAAASLVRAGRRSRC